MAPIPRLKPYDGPALFSYGFRPFFLFGALYAGLAMLLWLPVFAGEFAVPTAFSPRDWHVHEMLYGYVPAVVTGFLLTAIPNWTGRLPLQGTAARSCCSLALARRARRGDLLRHDRLACRRCRSTAASCCWSPPRRRARSSPAANRSNLSVVLAGRACSQPAISHSISRRISPASPNTARASGSPWSIMLITLIGGRIVPSFTRNWLARENPGRLPVPFGRFDMVVDRGRRGRARRSGSYFRSRAVAAHCAARGGVLHAARLVRWAGDRTARERLVLILHLGYAFVPARLPADSAWRRSTSSRRPPASTPWRAARSAP